jgi:F0F1-type ATP synthase assembly protein I
MNRRKRTFRGPEPSTVVLLARMAGIGWYIAISIAGGALLGAWLDRQFGTQPVLLLGGLAVGLVLAFLGMMRLLKWFAARGGGTDEAE